MAQLILFWVFGAVACVCTCIILSIRPPLLAATLVAAVILTPQYLQGRHHTVTTIEALQVEDRDGKPYVVTSPLPEYIVISSDLWNRAESYDPQVDGDTGLEPPAMWVERVEYGTATDADPDAPPLARELFHVDASNVSATFGPAQLMPDGNRMCQLVTWAEK